MSIEKKFYRLADGKLFTVAIESDDDQYGQNPRQNDSNGSILVTWERQYASPDQATDLPTDLDDAVHRWADKSGIDGYLFDRYMRIAAPGDILYLGVLNRDGHGGLIIDDNPRPGEHHDGIVVVTRDSWAGINGDTVPTVESARELAQWEVKRYAAWATGEVFGYVAADSDGKEIDSCWGYIGTDEIAYMFKQGTASAGEGAEEIDEADYDAAVTELHADRPHVGHFSHIGGTWWCDTCNSAYCDLA